MSGAEAVPDSLRRTIVQCVSVACAPAVVYLAYGLRPFFERNFAACCVIVFCAYGVLYGASTSLPGLLQNLFGYDAYVSGLVMSPSGVFPFGGLPGASLFRGPCFVKVSA